MDTSKVNTYLLAAIVVLLLAGVGIQAWSTVTAQSQATATIDAINELALEVATQTEALTDETTGIMAHLVDESASEAVRRQRSQDMARILSRRLTDVEEIGVDYFSAYEDSAYGPSVDRIAEQQLIAAEFQLLGLQQLSLENQLIAELLLLTFSE